MFPSIQAGRTQDPAPCLTEPRPLFSSWWNEVPQKKQKRTLSKPTKKICVVRGGKCKWENTKQIWILLFNSWREREDLSSQHYGPVDENWPFHYLTTIPSSLSFFLFPSFTRMIPIDRMIYLLSLFPCGSILHLLSFFFISHGKSDLERLLVQYTQHTRHTHTPLHYY